MLAIKTRVLHACPVCGSGRLGREQAACDFETQTGKYEIVCCASCGVGFTNPQPLECELPRLYASRTSTDFPRVNALTARLRTANIDRSVSKILRDLPAGEPLNALDYGCGDGAFSIGVAKHPRIRLVTAVDFHEEAPQLLREARTSKLDYVSIAQFEKRPGQFHIAFLRHVLEHSFRPGALLEQILERLHPRGRVIIEVPNFQSLGRKIFGGNYSALYLPRHLYHFRIQSLQTLVQRYFRVLSVEKTHTPLWGKSIGNLCGINVGNTGLLGVATFPFQILADTIAGTSSVITVIAQKES
jgi:2-polyprenyl-3-methyl-5-hydroxy-6-metoxy-1,4-benzoquinol methylase